MTVTALQSVQFKDPYDLKRTIESGQAFHWAPSEEDSWETAWRGSWVGTKQVSNKEIIIETNSADDAVLSHVADYFQCDVDVASIFRSFPNDPLMQKAVQCRSGLRLLRQDPWLCLASFILSSTKQITQIKEIVRLMSLHLGKSIPSPKGDHQVYTFPDPRDIVRAGESAVRQCKSGFRAKYIYRCAQEIDSGRFDLQKVRSQSLGDARNNLISLPGVGPKIADCVLLFAYGFSRAFPIDVWIQRVLQDYYFGGDKVSRSEMIQFIDGYFGANAGFAQQYLFDYIRSLSKSEWASMVACSPFCK